MSLRYHFVNRDFHKSNEEWSTVDEIDFDDSVTEYVLYLVDLVQRAERYDGWEGPIHYEIASGETTKAIMELAEIGGEIALKTLISALQNTLYDLPADVAEALGKMGRAEAVEPLIKSLNHPSAVVREEVVLALGAIGDNRAVDVLIPLLSDKHPSITNAAAKALGNIKDSDCLDSLWKVALNHQDVYCRISASKSIGMLSSNKSVDMFLDYLNDSNKEKKFVAVVALGQIGDERASQPLVEILGTTHSGLLSKTFLDIVGESINSLGLIKDENTVEPLVELAMKGEYKYKVADAIKSIGGMKGVELLIKFLNHKDDQIRERAVNLMYDLVKKTDQPKMKEVYSAKCVDAVIKSLKDGNENVMKVATRILSEIKDERTIVPLILSYQKEKYTYNSSISGAISTITDDLMGTLIQNYKSGDSTLRQHIQYGVMGIHSISNKGVSVLINSLNDNDEQLKLIIINLLSNSFDENAVESLIDLLNDKSDSIRIAAIRALGEIRNKKATESLVKLLTDDNSDVRGLTCFALGMIGELKSTKIIEDIALNDSDNSVRLTATYSLGDFKDHSSGDTLAKLLYDPDDEIKKAAAGSLFNCIGDSGIPMVEKAFKDNQSMLTEVLTSWKNEKLIRFMNL